MQKWEIGVLCFTFGSVLGWALCAIMSINKINGEAPHFVPEEDSRLD